ncbi:MAG: hypothetical protein WCU80_09100 [Paludibacteraceae bacterium]
MNKWRSSRVYETLNLEGEINRKRQMWMISDVGDYVLKSIVAEM